MTSLNYRRAATCQPTRLDATTLSVASPVRPVATTPEVEVAPSTTMRAIGQPAYGGVDVLLLEEVHKPEVGAHEVLVRVHASAASVGDLHLLTGTPYLIRVMGFGFLRPKNRIPGMVVAGRVEAVGEHVTEFSVGDDVYGELLGGAFAEYVCAKVDALALMPRSRGYESAAAIPWAATTALQGLRDVGGIEPGDNVLVNGASGSVGTYAVQLAKALGATVTAVCSTRNVERMRRLGADATVDYSEEDFTELGADYDVLLDLVGNRSPRDCKKILKERGVYVACAGKMSNEWTGPITWMLGVALTSAFSSQTMTGLAAKPSKDDLVFLARLVDSGQLVPVIDGRFELAEVPEAMRYLEAGHSQGTTVVVI